MGTPTDLTGQQAHLLCLLLYIGWYQPKFFLRHTILIEGFHAGPKFFGESHILAGTSRAVFDRVGWALYSDEALKRES